MIPMNSLLLATAIFTDGLAASPRLISRADEPDLELMECGRLPPIRVPHGVGMEVMECRPLSDSLPIDFTNSGASSVAGNVNLNVGARRYSSSSDDNPIYATALEHPATQRMNSEIEMADLGLIGPGHLDSSAPNDTMPAPAMSTGTATSTGRTPSRARCMQCVESCGKSLSSATEAVADYCAVGRNRRCSRDQQIGCVLISLTCCSMLGVALGIHNIQAN